MRHFITAFVFSLHCSKNICDFYLIVLDFNDSCKFNNKSIDKITEEVE